MFIPFVATRYLFSRRRLSTINLTTWVSMAGVAIGTMALICVLSVMNGFERVISESFSAFDPELRISPVRGSHFSSADSSIVEARQAIPDAVWAEVIEIDGLISSDESQSPVKVLGVDHRFNRATGIDSMMWSGIYDPHADPHYGINAAIGVGLATRIHCYPDPQRPMVLYAPRSRRVNLARPDANFTKTPFVCNGLFMVQQTVYDDNYIIMPIASVRESYQFDDDYVSSVSVRLSPQRAASDKEIKEAKRTLTHILGDRFIVADRYEQQADFYRISRIEKWTTFMILCFIILVATFTVVGSLSMIIIEKKTDIGLLKALGATHRAILHLFTLEGVMISAVGGVIGAIVGITLVLIQQYFGVIELGTSGYITQAYPVQLAILDVAITIIAVVGMSLPTSYYAAQTNIGK